MTTHTGKQISTLAMVERLKQSDQDFEWYPTTLQMIKLVKRDINNHFKENVSVLECGAGDGRVLKVLTKGDRFAIEKSTVLLETLDNSIFIVGTDFHAQTLIDKRCDIIFSNPPYSEFKVWANKIIREGNADVAYMILPIRWKEDDSIQATIKARGATAEVLGTLDFLQAERQARCQVDVIKIEFESYSRSLSDPFELWFDDNFKIKANTNALDKYDFKSSCKKGIAEVLKNEIVPGRDRVQILESLYQRDLAKLVNNYKSIEQLDPEILSELNVNIQSLKKGLKLKISSLKDVYWHELFDMLETVTRRLTTNQRTKMLNKLMATVHVDFTASNAYAIALWAVKHANHYFDQQLIDVFDGLIRQASVINYKSNKRTFGDDEWKWHARPSNLERFQLDYRFILDNAGGLSTSPWSHEKKRYNGLTERAKTILDDIRTVADNLGFSVAGYPSAAEHDWFSESSNEFMCDDRRTGIRKPLMVVRAYKNGNLHLKFDVDFMSMLCVEFGRLKGWLRSPREAVDEMGISPECAQASFGSNARIGVDVMTHLGLCPPDNCGSAELAA